MHTYKYPRPAVTVDAILFRQNDLGRYEVLLIERKHEPYTGMWAFPGGFVDKNENPDDAVHRELAEETSLTGLTFQPLGFWGRPGRDPRGHTISLVYWGQTTDTTLSPTAADDAARAEWFELNNLPALAFDHGSIIQNAIDQLTSSEAS